MKLVLYSMFFSLAVFSVDAVLVMNNSSKVVTLINIIYEKLMDSEKVDLLPGQNFVACDCIALTVKADLYISRLKNLKDDTVVSITEENGQLVTFKTVSEYHIIPKSKSSL